MPNINAVFPNLSSNQHLSSALDQSYFQNQRAKNLGSPLNNNVRSPLLLQPQNLHNLSNNTATKRPQNHATSSLVPNLIQQQHSSIVPSLDDSLKPRSYSASSEMLLTNAQYKFNQNTRALVGSPIHQYHRYNNLQKQPQRPRAASSSSMLQDMPIHHPIPNRMYHHPYQQLPGASLSLQTLNLNKSGQSAASNKSVSQSTPSNGSNGCVYLRPEQNIPEVFADPGTVFKPIDEIDNTSDVNDNENNMIGHSENPGAISRDDIVVTMRSVNV